MTKQTTTKEKKVKVYEDETIEFGYVDSRTDKECKEDDKIKSVTTSTKEKKCISCNERKVYDSVGRCIICNYQKMLGVEV